MIADWNGTSILPGPVERASKNRIERERLIEQAVGKRCSLEPCRCYRSGHEAGVVHRL